VVSRSAVLDALSSDLVEKKLYLQLQQLAEEAVDLDPSTTAHFHAGYAAQMLNERERARAAYEALLEDEPNHHPATRNLILLLDQQRDLARIQNFLPHIVAMAKEQPDPWAATLTLAREAEARAKADSADQRARDQIRDALSNFPPLSHDFVSIDDLSLVDAAHLIALLRACDIDHATWTLRALGRSSTPFDPTNFMRGALLSLAKLGIISNAESSPRSAFEVDQSGDVSYYLHQIEWRIGPATIQLAERIRTLPRTAWPSSWQEQLSIVARDLAVEECVAYVEHLAEERNLITPDRADLRVLFREMIETTSVTRCWYFIYLGVVSTNDYKTRYRATSDRIATHMLNRIREKWERGTREQWGKEYGRPSTLPRSQIAAALHDVLTGWGERAFERILADLAVERDANVSPTGGHYSLTLLGFLLSDWVARVFPS
jgi:tetratricopeptide (TPR) repeat protein